MFGLMNLAFMGGGGGGFSAEAQDFFARSTVPFSEPRKIAINAMIVSLKAAGLWAKLDYLRVLSQETEQAALLNWKGDVHNGTVTETVDFIEDEGEASNGSTGFINSGFNPGDGGGHQYVRDSAHFGFWSRTDLNASVYDMGQRTSNVSQIAALRSRNGGTLTAGINEDSLGLSVAVADTLGHFVVTRTGPATTAVYKNGALLIAGTGASVALPNRVFYECGLNSSGTLTTPSTRQCSMFHAGAGLNATEIANLYTIGGTYFDAILEV